MAVSSAFPIVQRWPINALNQIRKLLYLILFKEHAIVLVGRDDPPSSEDQAKSPQMIRIEEMFGES